MLSAGKTRTIPKCKDKEKEIIDEKEETGMSRKRSRTYSVQSSAKKVVDTIDMNEMNWKKAYHPVTFRTGPYMTEKDRPRKKNWAKEVSGYGYE